MKMFFALLFLVPALSSAAIVKGECTIKTKSGETSFKLEPSTSGSAILSGSYLGLTAHLSAVGDRFCLILKIRNGDLFASCATKQSFTSKNPLELTALVGAESYICSSQMF